MDGRTMLLRSISEADWQNTVTDAATVLGWWWFHDNDPRRNEAGWPDLVLIRPPRFLLVEVKTETGRVTRVQQGVLDMLGRCPGVETYVWRPRDEPTMKQVLA